MRKLIFSCLFIFLNFSFILCRNHEIRIKNDKRSSIVMNNFGYFPNGFLFINITKFNVSRSPEYLSGFTLDRTLSTGISSRVDSSGAACMLQEANYPPTLEAIVLLYRPVSNTLTVHWRGDSISSVPVLWGASRTNLAEAVSATKAASISEMQPLSTGLQNSLNSTLASLCVRLLNLSSGHAFTAHSSIMNILRVPRNVSQRQHDAIVALAMQTPSPSVLMDVNVISDLRTLIDFSLTQISLKSDKGHKSLIKLQQSLTKENGTMSAALPISMLISFPTSSEEGEYELFFHNCVLDKKAKPDPVNMEMILVEKNVNSFLSAGDYPLPLLFFLFCGAYLFVIIIWSVVLRTSKHMVFKIHYLMLTLLVMKTFTLFFHAINFYELGKYGVQEQGWAIMYYITHLLKGALLFTTIILIGAGWAFIKHILGSKEKKIFLIIIPLQVLANVAAIIIDESEESAVRYLTWRNIFLLVDLVCCGAILLPVVWSIKHLKDASTIDGKQAMCLRKLRLFRHFYILIICYIYLTRIVVYLLVATVSFKLQWTVDLFRETATVGFFLVTGYKFRPVPNNPYLEVPDEDEDEEAGRVEQQQMEHAWSQSGATDGVVKLTSRMDQSDSEEDETDDRQQVLFQKDLPDNKSGTANQNGAVHTTRL